jgi:hypothetical protein
VIDTLTSSEDGTGRVLPDPSTGTALDLNVSDGTAGSYVVDGESNIIAVITDAGTETYTATYDLYGTGGKRRLVLESNRQLGAAVHLYETMGFRHLEPHEREASPYVRADVAMRLDLH